MMKPPKLGFPVKPIDESGIPLIHVGDELLRDVNSWLEQEQKGAAREINHGVGNVRSTLVAGENMLINQMYFKPDLLAVVDDLRDLPRRSPAKAGIVALVEKEEGVEK